MATEQQDIDCDVIIIGTGISVLALYTDCKNAIQISVIAFLRGHMKLVELGAYLNIPVHF